MCSLKSRLLAVEDDYLHALAEGEHSVVAFGQHWELLMADIDAALEANDLDEETTSLAHATATRISTLVDTSIDIYSLYNVHTSELVAEVNSLMFHLSLADLAPTPSVESPMSPAISIMPFKVDRKSSARKRVRDAGEDSGSDSGKRCRTDTESSPHSIATSSDIGQLTNRSPFIAAQSGAPSAPPRMAPLCSPTITTDRASRKRRMSEGDSSPSLVPPSKRLHIGPRLHAVSDSFPGLCAARSAARPCLASSSSDNLPAASRTTSASLSSFDIQSTTALSDKSEIMVDFAAAPMDLGAALDLDLACSSIPPDSKISCASPVLDPILYQPGGDLSVRVTSVTDILCGGLSDFFPCSPDSTLSTTSGRSTPMTPSPSEGWILPPPLFEVDSDPHRSDNRSPYPLQPTGAKNPSGPHLVAICSPDEMTQFPVEDAVGTELNWDALFGSLDPSVWLSLPPPPHWQFDDAGLSSKSGSDLLAALSSPIHGVACSPDHPIKHGAAHESCGVLA